LPKLVAALRDTRDEWSSFRDGPDRDFL